MPAMEAVGALYEPSAQERLARLVARHGVTTHPHLAAPRPPTLRHGHLHLLIVEILVAHAPTSLRACEIRDIAQQRLGQAVSWSSVKNALAKNVDGQSAKPLFERVGYGRYRLLRADESESPTTEPA